MADGDHGSHPANHSFPPTDTPVLAAAGSLVQLRTEWVGFYDAHYHRVVRFMMHVGASLAAAQDAAQEAFIRVMGADEP